MESEEGSPRALWHADLGAAPGASAGVLGPAGPGGSGVLARAASTHSACEGLESRGWEAPWWQQGAGVLSKPPPPGSAPGCPGRSRSQAPEHGPQAMGALTDTWPHWGLQPWPRSRSVDSNTSSWRARGTGSIALVASTLLCLVPAALLVRKPQSRLLCVPLRLCCLHFLLSVPHRGLAWAFPGPLSRLAVEFSTRLPLLKDSGGLKPQPPSGP